MFKQLCRLQRYTFLHELPNVFNTFLHELSAYAYTFLHELSSYTCISLHELSSYYVHDNRFPILFIIIDCLHILPQFLVERMFRHRLLVAQDDEFHAGSRHRHIHAAEVFQETDLSFIVGAYQRDEDHVSFLPLETIYRVYADQTAVRLEELIFLDELLEILYLGTVRRNDAYIDSFLQNAPFAYLGEVFRQGKQGKLGFCLVDTPETLAYKLLLEVQIRILIGCRYRR